MSNYEKMMERTKWFREDRFGMFIHWGLYTIPARGEWIRCSEKMSKEKYEEYFNEFYPTQYDPKKWARLAKTAGMKYAVMTAKHHDGFCLFDSKYTEYKSTNTKAKRDLIREYVEAFRAEGIKVGIYYSLIDWHHDDYPHYGDMYHPMRDNEAFKDVKHDFKNYLKYMYNQIEELVTNYGKIDLMWFDFSYGDMVGEKWEATKIVELVRKHQPGILIDNRMGSAGNNMMAGGIRDEEPCIYAGDFASPEKIIPIEPIKNKAGKQIPWEACVTMNDNWGYSSKDKNFKSPETLIKTLVNCVSKDGNLLLNVGPNSKGEIPEESVDILESIGKWMRYNSDSIYGCGSSCYEKPQWGRYTQKGNKLYAHILEEPIGPVYFEGMKESIEKARFLKDGSELKVETPWNAEEYKDYGFITLPSHVFKTNYPVVVELTIK
ncbi:MAG: alpha-L-fucosidase [Clostridium cadaveris]|uniref:alpha-L-fucosidase n=1 Tax=Clostridium cadaveris TaxID=1529 RepID=UPI002A87FEF1|nr:alpha-L-fucosidase [Clostridium cadaveris]